ncbi:GGDEF domain-containing protein [Zhengella sp. ZM62]|uniref:GGDEF domain-containing protein n=1 Tax=Zhengella sedimenti TaxID=3390035 RepID=UPI003975F4E5
MQLFPTRFIARVSVTILVCILFPVTVMMAGALALDMAIGSPLAVLLAVATAVAVLAALVIMQRELRPVVDAALALEAHAGGREHLPIINEARDEVGRLSAAARRTMDTVDRLLEELERQAVTDPLTGLPNRDAFMTAMGMERSAIFAILDIDGLKAINDSRGHETGDAVLRDVAQVLRKSLRSADMLARWGGAAFAVMLHRPSVLEAIEAVTRARKAVAAKSIVPGHPVTVSAGVIQMTGDLERDILLAFRALNAAKEAGRNRVVFAPPASAGRPLAPEPGQAAWTQAGGEGMSRYLN